MRRALTLIACLCAAMFTVAPAAAADGNGVARTPPMGWNDWYSAFCSVNAQLVEQTAQMMVADGMRAAGYDYVNIDDCWMAPSRDAAGNLVPDPTRFPDGIAPVAAYVHSLGLKLGIYEDAGTLTCANFPGSYGHEAQDAATFASWGVDYVKYDRCNIPYSDLPGETPEQVQQTLYTRMSRALQATGRPIVFSMCNPDPGDDPWLWAPGIANMWRTTLDGEDNFGSILANFESNVDLFRHAGPGAWNDPDLLQIGNGGSSLLEYRSEFSLWAEMAAPLIASTRLDALSPSALAIYENRAVIAVDQDPLGQQGVPVASANGLWVLTKKLRGGDRAVVLFNTRDAGATITTSAAAVGLPSASSYRLQNLWSGYVSESNGAISAFVPAHGVTMFRVTASRKRDQRDPTPQIVLSLTPASTQLVVGQRTTLWETIADNGTTPIKRLKLTFRVQPGWRLKRLGPARRRRLDAGHRFTVVFTVTAPAAGPPLAVDALTGTASYTTIDGPRVAAASLGERVSTPVPAPLQTTDETGRAASFGTSEGAQAIDARGLGVAPFSYAGATNSTRPASDSYAAIYAPGAAAPSSTAQVTVTSDPAGGTSGGAGLIERDAMTAPRGSAAGIVLYVSSEATIVMAWNASGGADVDRTFTVPGVLVGAPVTLRLVRSGATYTGYYSTDGGATWAPAATVTVAAAAAAGNQDVGIFHASGLSSWRTTATFRDLSLR